MNDKILEINNEINDFYNKLNIINNFVENKNKNNKFNNFKNIFKNYDENTILKFKNTEYKDSLSINDINKLLVRINKKNGKIYNFVKIINIINNKYIKICDLKNNNIRIINCDKYFLFVLKYNNFRDFLESFL